MEAEYDSGEQIALLLRSTHYRKFFLNKLSRL